jgi:hypothetical protein
MIINTGEVEMKAEEKGLEIFGLTFYNHIKSTDDGFIGANIFAKGAPVPAATANVLITYGSFIFYNRYNMAAAYIYA